MPRWLARAGSVGMSLVALVMTHNLVYLAAYGAAYEDVLVRTGHDEDWTIAVGVILALAAGLVLLCGWRVARLWAEARTLRATRSVRRPDPADLLAGLGVTWLRLAAATGAAFLVQENLERASIGQPLPGLGVFGSLAFPNALPILVGVTFAVALVGALFRWRIETLAARIAAARRARWARPAHTPRRSIPLAHRLAGSIHGRLSAGRAPPLLLTID
ncbi:MAG TPA: hypothetical protein VEG29_08515 [Candidatus Binatia bacterium]|nr:hypothetical protein [Candidatus Binatia bacterium]